MEDNRSRGITSLAISFPFFVLLLVPEITNSVIWLCWFIVESINHSSFGSVMETRVGLGLIYSIMVYVFFFVVGTTTLGFVIWRIVQGVKTARGLLSLSEKSRKTVIKTNFIYSIFIIVALFLCNYCNLPGRSDVKPFNDGIYERKACTEGNSRKGIQILDLLILPYYVYTIYYFTRPKVKEQFK